MYRSLPHVQHVQQDLEEDLADPDFIYEAKITTPSSPKRCILISLLHLDPTNGVLFVMKIRQDAITLLTYHQQQ